MKMMIIGCARALSMASTAMANSVTITVGSTTCITTTDGNGGRATTTCTSVGRSVICD